MGTPFAGRGSVGSLDASPIRTAQQAHARLRTPEADEPVRDPATHRLMYPPRARVPIFVQRRDRRGGLADAGHDLKERARALLDAMRPSSIVRLVADEREAVVLVEILDQAPPAEQAGLVAMDGPASPENRLVVWVRAICPSTKSTENRLSFRMAWGRGRTAENLVDQIERWAIRNHGLLLEMMVEARTPLSEERER